MVILPLWTWSPLPGGRNREGVCGNKSHSKTAKFFLDAFMLGTPRHRRTAPPSGHRGWQRRSDCPRTTTSRPKDDYEANTDTGPSWLKPVQIDSSLSESLSSPGRPSILFLVTPNVPLRPAEKTRQDKAIARQHLPQRTWGPSSGSRNGRGPVTPSLTQATRMMFALCNTEIHNVCPLYSPGQTCRQGPYGREQEQEEQPKAWRFKPRQS